MRLGRFSTAFVLLLIIFAAYIILVSPLKRSATQDNSAAEVIEGLWSANEGERVAAKEKLIQLGQRAVPPLISLLEDVLRNPTPRYVRGKEKEVEESKNRLRQLGEKDGNEKEKIVFQLSSFVINWRLKSDVCELLGQLHAEAAIPILVEMMEREDSVSQREIMNPAMKALAEIGPGAVPKLVEAIETAERRAASTVFGDGHKPSDFFIRIETAKIQSRASMVLGEIGDASALPVLQDLLNQVNNESLTPYVKDAIRKIQDKK